MSMAVASKSSSSSGTTSSLSIATGQVTGLCQPRHRNQELLPFLRQVARAHATGELPLVMDNDAAHERPEIGDGLKANPRIHAHFTPTSPPWMNLVELRHLRPRPDHQDPGLHRRLEHPRPAPHLDQNCRPDPHENQPNELQTWRPE